MSGRANGGRLRRFWSITTADWLEYSEAGGQSSAAGQHQPQTANGPLAIQQHNQKTGHIVPQLQHVPPALIFLFRLAARQRCDDATSDPVLLDGESLV